MRRELNLYFTAMSAGEALLLIRAGMQTALFGNRGFGLDAANLEETWRRRFGGEDAVAFPSARTGLYALLRSLGVGQGDEVIITGFTCTAVPVPVIQCGAVPVYADIDPRTYGMDPPSVERLIGPKTRAVVVQHTFGIPAAVTELVSLARSRGIYVIEDACLALGSRLNGKLLGSFGDATIFSFELSKTISAGWGGMVQANIPELGESLRSIRQKRGLLGRKTAALRLEQGGLSRFFYHPSAPRIGKYFLAGLFKLGIFQYSTCPEELEGRLPSEAFASPADATWRVISNQLERLDQILDHSRDIAGRYREVLQGYGWPVGDAAGGEETVRLIRFPLLVKNRDRMTQHFSQAGIELGRWFDHPISPEPENPEVFHYPPTGCPVAEKVSRHIVNLPLHSRLSSADIDRVCLVLGQYLSQHPEEREFAGEFLATGALS